MSTLEKTFDLKSGQTYSDNDKKMTCRSRWYREDGKWIGYGDLSSDDFKKISSKLKWNELFIVLTESSSEWNDRSIKTADHLVEHALYVITHNTMFCVDRYSRGKGARIEKDLIFLFINEKEFRELVHSCFEN